MAYLNGLDIRKHDFKYLKELLKKIKNKELVKTKQGDVLIEFSSILEELEETLDLRIIHEGPKYFKIFGDFKLTDIDKSQFTSLKDKTSGAESTHLQELCSLEIMKKILAKDKFSMERLERIYPELREKTRWQESFKAQYECMKNVLRDSSFSEFNKDGNFMSFISSLVRKHGISRKDTWNPADVWLLKHEFGSNFDLLHDLWNSRDIKELNEKLIDSYIKKDIVGISLKKTGKEASYCEYNLGKKSPTRNYKFKEIYIPFSYNEEIKDFINKSSYLDLEDNIRCSVRLNKTEINRNIIYEFKQSAEAQMGKVPIDMLNSLNQEYSLEKTPAWKLLPNKETYDELFWLSVFRKIQDLYFRGLLRSPESLNLQENEFIRTVRNFSESPTINGSSVLQSILFFSEFSKLKDPQISEYSSKMCLLSQKIGEEFGPFGKLS